MKLKGLLIGESANQSVVNSIRDIITLQPEVDHVNEILTMHMGPDFILVNISIDFDDSTNAGDVEKTIAKMDKKIKQTCPTVQRIFIEAETANTRNNTGM